MKSFKLLSFNFLIVGVFAIVLPATLRAATWSVDKAHTEVNFSVKHFFTPVNGSFGKWDIDLQYDAEKRLAVRELVRDRNPSHHDFQEHQGRESR
jgi:polyisoprenoid-binding protein YceI